MKKAFIVLMSILMAVMMIAGCGGGEKKAAQAPKVLKVGTEPTFAPFEFQKEGSKEFDGFDMDLIRAIGKQLNMKVEILNMGFDALIPAINAGNIDLAIAGMSITPDRQKAVDPKSSSIWWIPSCTSNRRAWVFGSCVLPRTASAPLMR